jgi:aminoglycoside 3-N-acetyltransferase
MNPFSLQAIKRSVKSVIRLTSLPWATEKKLTQDLKALGIGEGEVLMVHSALSTLGYVPGGAISVIRALLNVIGPEGTLVMPTHSWDQQAKGVFSFDVRSTPSCVGTISEVFRTLPDVRRSTHPTHSVAACGNSAASIVEGHELAATPCGLGTPYAKLMESRAKILFLGTTLEQNSLYHTLESIAQVPYQMRPAAENFTITDAAGNTSERAFNRHAKYPPVRFLEPQDLLIAKGALVLGKVAASRSQLADASKLADIILGRLDEDATYLLAR